jgi:hypothetical protein
MLAGFDSHPIFADWPEPRRKGELSGLQEVGDLRFGQGVAVARHAPSSERSTRRRCASLRIRSLTVLGLLEVCAAISVDFIGWLLSIANTCWSASRERARTVFRDGCFPPGRSPAGVGRTEAGAPPLVNAPHLLNFPL